MLSDYGLSVCVEGLGEYSDRTVNLTDTGVVLAEVTDADARVKTIESVVSIDGMKHYVLEGMLIRIRKHGRITDVPVECIQSGDVIVGLHQMYVIQDVYHHNLPLAQNNLPYVIPKDYFGKNEPTKDTVISGYFRVFYQNRGLQHHRAFKQQQVNGTKYSFTVRSRTGLYSAYINGLLVMPLSC